MNLQGYGLESGYAASLVILPAQSGFDAVRRQTPVQYSLREGVLIAQTQLAKTLIHLDEDHAVDFNS